MRWTISSALGGTGAIATLLYLSIAFGKLTINTLNAYGSLMCLATVYSCGKQRVRVSQSVRLLVLAVIITTATAIAIIGQHSFLSAFKSFLLFLLTFFTPWSAINLVDYYFFNHQAIDMEALNDPNGKYRAWNVTGLGVYLVGVAVQTPFIDSGFYSGPFVKMLGGIDISGSLGWCYRQGSTMSCAKRSPQRRLAPPSVVKGELHVYPLAPLPDRHHDRWALSVV